MKGHLTTEFRGRPEPFFTLLGLQLDEVQPDFCRMRLPFRLELRTAGEVVHGGAIASLIDSAGVIAVWSNVDPNATRGATASITVNYLAAAERVDLTAEARVIRRGRSVVFVDVDVTAPSGERIAKGMVTYKLGYGGKE
jgi:uncharacterized protein (TIGR00369 family)